MQAEALERQENAVSYLSERAGGVGSDHWVTYQKVQNQKMGANLQDQGERLFAEQDLGVAACLRVTPCFVRRGC